MHYLNSLETDLTASSASTGVCSSRHFGYNDDLHHSAYWGFPPCRTGAIPKQLLVLGSGVWLCEYPKHMQRSVSGIPLRL